LKLSKRVEVENLAEQTPIIEFKSVSLAYGDTEILKGIDLSLEQGKFYTLLGPSGSGKTTILNLISGQLAATSGDILFENKRINDVPVEKRTVNTVFQDYALFPNMNVFENVAFGPSIKKMSKTDIERQVHDMLKLVKLDQYADRDISELSGGDSLMSIYSFDVKDMSKIEKELNYQLVFVPANEIHPLLETLQTTAFVSFEE